MAKVNYYVTMTIKPGDELEVDAQLDRVAAAMKEAGLEVLECHMALQNRKYQGFVGARGTRAELLRYGFSSREIAGMSRQGE